MRINNNIAALNAWRGLSGTDNALSKSLEKLSSGLRINRAGDDAAGLAISEKMRGQIRGLDQATRNAQDAISLIQTAEGSLNEAHAILQRMRELAVQGANDTNTAEDRAEIQNELDQLTAEINRIGETTEFNSKNLLNGGAGLQVEFLAKQSGGVDTNWINVVGGTADTKATGATNIGITEATAATGAEVTFTATAGQAAASSIVINGTTVNFTGLEDAEANATAFVAAINELSDELGVIAANTGTSVSITNTNASGASSELSVTLAEAQGGTAATAAGVKTQGVNATITSGQIAADDMIASGNTITVIRGDYKGLELKLTASVMDASDNTATLDIIGNGTLGMQIGANEGQSMSISIGDMRASALGITTLDASTAAQSSSAVTTIDGAIEKVSTERSKLGAYQNRLDHTIKNLGVAAENLTAAESRIRDVDMAHEMMNFTRQQILMQAGTAMMAQANARPQSVLQLLG